MTINNKGATHFSLYELHLIWNTVFRVSACICPVEINALIWH